MPSLPTPAAAKPPFHLALASLTTLKGVGEKLRELLVRLAGPKVIDLALHLPVNVIDRRQITPVGLSLAGTVATLIVTVKRIETPTRFSLPTRIHCTDDSGPLLLAYFNVKGDWLSHQYKPGMRLAVSGKIELYQGTKQIVHPDYVVPADRAGDIAILEPVYPLTTGLTAKQLRTLIAEARSKLNDVPEWLDETMVSRQSWPGFPAAITSLHCPRDGSDINEISPPRQRLAYDELLANQLTLALLREKARIRRGVARHSNGKLRAQVLANMPYQLTGAQQRALEEIYADLNAPTRMVRLLQGDVGSGKTIVALLTLLVAIESGEQGALMAPTEILANQHYLTLQEMLRGTGVKLALYTGSAKGKARAALLAGLSSGSIDLVIGTHALFQSGVEFARLGCAVIDEQHRFGVAQRVELTNKGNGVDLLVMTATPIPRSLALTYYGDMEVSKLDEKPPGRQPITTVLIDLARLDEVINRIKVKLSTGERVYWVCPLIEASEAIDVAAAEERARLLEQLLGRPVGLLHGRMPADKKQAAMDDFASGAIPILVATTVIEVGVNVPEATVMVIDHAERFGLAQLHQLRGRVGRGNKASSCLLLYASPLGEDSAARLKLMRDSEDGFKLAEEDLRLRGVGDVIGTRQSGTPDFRIADIGLHQDLLLTARDEAKYILARDPDLTGPRGPALRLLLRLFGMETAISYLRSG